MLQLNGDEKEPLSVRLEPLGALAGRILTADGQPLAGRTVLAIPAWPDKPPMEDESQKYVTQFQVEAVTDPQGKFRLEGLLPQMRYLLALSGGDPENRGAIGRHLKEGLAIEAGKTKDLGDLKSKQMPEK